MNRPPNFIVIFTDDQGYNDLGCFGSPTIRTPRIDRMAAEGTRCTDFYVSSPVCTPSRASLLTGCYAQRVNMSAFPGRDEAHPQVVLFPPHRCGLNPGEVTLAKVLKSAGYATACIGKWHVGSQIDFLPTRHGFDSFFGIPYSNDMNPVVILRDEDEIERDPDQGLLTERYTEEAIRFIRAFRYEPFFLYLPHTMPHVPLHVSHRFAGKSARGLYGDVIEAIDWSTGQILDTLAELGIEEHTLVLFTSDNGPWLAMGERGGSAYPLRNGKGSTYEGGMREPCVVRWPGTIPPERVCSEVMTTMDCLPTFAALAGAQLPAGHTIDGKDITPLLRGDEGATSPHEALFYYMMDDLQAVRSGPWKLVLEHPYQKECIYGHNDQPDRIVPEALYNLVDDVRETRNVIDRHPAIAQRLRGHIDRMRVELGDSRTGQPGTARRPRGACRD